MPESDSSRSGDTAARYERACQLFHESLELDAIARIQWLQEQVNGDANLLSQVEAMLQVDDGFADSIENSTTRWDENDLDDRAAQILPSKNRRVPNIPNYEMVEEIARGGMGVVYKAEQLRPRRTVALKMMRSGQFASDVEVSRFLAEAEAAAQLDDATVVPVYEVGEFEGEPFIAMKFIDGMTFEQKLRSVPMSIQEIVTTLLPVCYAIAAAHEKGIIHRDLKPSNILIDQATQRAWVTDFGLAKMLYQDSCFSVAGDVMGTPGFMAPEQSLGDSDIISAATDVYGLGAVLYRALTGNPPHKVDVDNPVEAMQQIRNNDITPPRQRNRQVSHSLNSICLKCLETNPNDRYANAGELGADLERFLDGDAVEARSLSWSRRLLGWARTHPGLAVSWCAIMVFYVYHVLCRYLEVHDDPRFDIATTTVTGLALVSAWTWQKLLSKTDGRASILYAWTASDVTLLTVLSLFADRENGQLLMLYPVIVAASALRCRPNLVGFVTLISMLGYGTRIVVLRYSNAGDPIPWIEAIPMLLCLGVIGVIQYLLLRRSAASLEAISAMTSASQLRSRSVAVRQQTQSNVPDKHRFK